MSYSQFEARPQPKSKRAFHPKVRTGCHLRRVRCDERKPYCKGCVRLGRICEYAAPTIQPKPMQLQLQQTLLPAPVPMWTEADSLRTAYYNAFQRYDPIGISNSETFAQVIPRESFSDDVFYPICMSLGALSLSSAARSIAGCDEQSLIPLATSSPADAVHAKAVRYYSTALSRLRERLGSEGASLSPRTLLLTTGAMASFELMQGNLIGSCHLQVACFSVLGDAVIAHAQSGKSERFGLTALHKDDLAIAETEAVHIRLAAMCLLEQPMLFKRRFQRTVPIPRPALGELPQPDAPTKTFQTSWNAFAQRLEDWKLACCWSICLNGTSAKLPEYLDDQRILVDCLHSWGKTITARTRLSRCLSLDHDHVQVLKVLLIYVRAMQLFLAPDDEDTQRFGSVHATDLADLARLPLRPMGRFIGGFLLGSWNDCFSDSLLLPMIKFSALKRKCATTTINSKLAKQQLDLGEAIWFTLAQYYEGSKSQHDAGFLPVRTRISWTSLWWDHYSDLFRAYIKDVGDEDHSYSCDTTIYTVSHDGSPKLPLGAILQVLHSKTAEYFAQPLPRETLKDVYPARIAAVSRTISRFVVYCYPHVPRNVQVDISIWASIANVLDDEISTDPAAHTSDLWTDLAFLRAAVPYGRGIPRGGGAAGVGSCGQEVPRIPRQGVFGRTGAFGGMEPAGGPTSATTASPAR
ncbi:hypothetical protein INS49_015876 [Diaporthe citri]|uniref:uncharacterized protein n=1 Tax=Diaporthe citri TaxID=83186 RepID=UPI001C82026F|nr:uncharacterized protein INS49_015876 [Diaporthe citri]KAG6356488.1 hypothetical protein INS49_015876 [Diaporthe citri]